MNIDAADPRMDPAPERVPPRPSLWLRVIALAATVMVIAAVAIPRFSRDADYSRLTAMARPGFAPPVSVPVATADSAVVIVYGDSRTGHLVLTQSGGARMIYEAFQSQRPSMWLAGLENVPVAGVQTLYPDFYGLRDVWSHFVTHRFTGGNQQGVLAALAAESHPDLVVNTGDIVENGRWPIQWLDFVRFHAPLRERAPFLVAPGNHEALWSERARLNWDAVFGAPTVPYHYWYSVELGGGLARFVVLDSNILTDPHDHYPAKLENSLVSEQLAWTDSVLALPARFKFVVLHHPLVTSGHHWDEWTSQAERPSADRRRPLFAILRRHGATAVFAGHEHLYQRSWVSRPGGGFWHVTTGGGGSPLHYVSAEDRARARVQGLPDSAAVGWIAPEQSAYHYCRLVLHHAPDGRFVADVRVYGVDRAGGIRLIDRFEIDPTSAGSALAAAPAP